MEFLTTSEAADYLRLGERKLYELVTSGTIPCSKVTGKWLFPRHELDLWVLSGMSRPATMPIVDPPLILGGSRDDLLDWCLRESGSALASLSEGTLRGIDRLQCGEVIATAINFHSADEFDHAESDPNVAAVRALPGLHDAVLIGIAKREQGLLITAGNPKNIRSMADVIAGAARIAFRQQGSGAQLLLETILARAGVTLRELQRLEQPCLSGRDLAAAIRSGDADCGIAPRATATAAGLDFLPLGWENFDLLTRQRSYFNPSMQLLTRFLSSDRIARRAAEMTGYDLTTTGTIRFAA